MVCDLKKEFSGNYAFSFGQIVGTPPEDQLNFLETPEARRFIMMQDRHPARPFTELCPNINPAGADLAQRMLAFDPARRITGTDLID